MNEREGLIVYQVIWSDTAEDRLLRIWNYWSAEGAALTPVLDEISSLRTQELAAITNACARIDRVLSQRPTRVGRPFRDQLTRRVFSAGPLEVGYDVIADDRRVFILTVRYDDRRN